MKLTKRGEYALRTLIRLGVASRMGRTVVSVSQLAAEEGISAKFLENILSDLKGAGYLKSVRGKLGGASLSCDIDQVKIGELVRFLDGRLAPIGCASETEYEPCSCPDETHCGLRMIMIDVRNAISGILDRYSLGDLVEVTMRKMERDGLLPSLPSGAAGKTAAATPSSEPSSGGRHSDPEDGFLSGLLNGLGKLSGNSGKT